GGSVASPLDTVEILNYTNPRVSNIALNSSANPSQHGQVVTFSASVSSAQGGTPTGSVTFSDGATTLGTFPVDGSGQAEFNTSGLDLGSHAITASYSGDGSFTSSTSSTVMQTVTATVETWKGGAVG